MLQRRRRPVPMIAACAGLALAGCATPRDVMGPWRPPEPAPAAPAAQAFSNIPYATWSDYEPDYRFYPGDEIEVAVPSAPELTKTLVVQPDGRITLPLVGPVMAADRTIPELEGVVAQAYSSQLLRPHVEVSAKAAPLKVFVGGEVGNPGVIDLTGDADALRAIIQAGGFRSSADASAVFIIRRGPDGRGMIRRADLLRGLRHAETDLVPLRRFDVIYVPRTGAANAGIFMQQYFRDLLPVSFSYALGAQAIQ
ncbi:polysaccharide export protein [Phenylobacterium sp. LjRoot164]|uniref:polysaccharide biosynthesis/export family protein n=1 Tax=unclassified Phenylobacterium TaxID=2640670 RepID=UPI003ED16A6C